MATWEKVVEGEQAMIFNETGRGRLIIGPRRVSVGVREEFEKLRREVASQDQYLEVKHRDGHKEHVPGPYEMFLNRLEVDNITVRSAIKIDSNHMIVVYKQLEGEINSRVVQGPTLFIPNAHEWLHEFVWHGSDKSNPGRFIPNKLKFKLLRHVPAQIYCNVTDVRTNDDTLVTVKLMIFYHLEDVDTMLKGTHDPIADFINAVQSDMVAFASKRTYDEFIQQTHTLNDMSTYSQLVSRSKIIGYHISKVVYRGYEASYALQSTHDKAVQTRTYIRLNKEAEEKEEVLQKFKLERETKRAKLKQEMQKKVQDHQQELERIRQTTELQKTQLKHESLLRRSMKGVELQVDLEKQENEQKAEFLQSLQDLGVDMTRYMLAIRKEIVPTRDIIVGPPAKEVQISPDTL